MIHRPRGRARKRCLVWSWQSPLNGPEPLQQRGCEVSRPITSSVTLPPRLAWHVLKLGDIERLRPCEAALGEHLKHRLDPLRVIQATERDEDRPWKAVQVTREDPRATIRAEVPIQPLARLRDVMKCLRLAAD